MPTTVTLEVKKNDGQVQRENHEIEDMNLFQFEKTMRVIKDIFSKIQADESLRDLFQSTVQADRSQYESLDKPQLKQMAEEQGIEVNKSATKEEIVSELVTSEKSQQVIPKLTSAFETLLVELPSDAIRLLSVLSAIPHDKLGQQKMMKVLDIYDAIIEENDIERLIERGKKSFELTKAKTTFLNKRRRATQA